MDRYAGFPCLRSALLICERTEQSYQGRQRHFLFQAAEGQLLEMFCFDLQLVGLGADCQESKYSGYHEIECQQSDAGPHRTDYRRSANQATR